MEAGARERKITGVISRNDTLYLPRCRAGRMRNAGSRARSMRWRGCGGRGMVRRCRPKMELGMGIHLEMARVEWSRARDQGWKKIIGDKVKSFHL